MLMSIIKRWRRRWLEPMCMKMKNNPLHDSCQDCTEIFSALLNFSSTIILLNWYIKLVKLSVSCSRTWSPTEGYLLAQEVHLVEVNSHQEAMQVKVQSPTQVVVHDYQAPNLGSSMHHVSVLGPVTDMHNLNKIDIKNHTLLLMGKYIAWFGLHSLGH
jgi:hypothetical protein